MPLSPQGGWALLSLLSLSASFLVVVSLAKEPIRDVDALLRDPVLLIGAQSGDLAPIPLA